MSEVETIAVVGGTGHLGAAIARRLAKAGCKVMVGSRVVERAQKTAADLGFGVMGASNVDAAAAADIIIVAVPFASQEVTLSEIAPHVAESSPIS